MPHPSPLNESKCLPTNMAVSAVPDKPTPHRCKHTNAHTAHNPFPLPSISAPDVHVGYCLGGCYHVHLFLLPLLLGLLTRRLPTEQPTRTSLSIIHDPSGAISYTVQVAHLPGILAPLAPSSFNLIASVKSANNSPRSCKNSTLPLFLNLFSSTPHDPAVDLPSSSSAI